MQNEQCGAWICSPCGKKHGTRVPTMATFHLGKCDYCGEETAVTEPRDYGHPLLKEARNN